MFLSPRSCWHSVKVRIVSAFRSRCRLPFLTAAWRRIVPKHGRVRGGRPSRHWIDGWWTRVHESRRQKSYRLRWEQLEPRLVMTTTIGGDPSIFEGSTYTLILSSDDGNVIDNWTVNWDDGNSPETVSGNPGSVNHTYPDGNRSYTISATLTDETDGTFPADNTQVVTVNNVAPSITDLTGATINEGQTVTLSGNISDPGINDTFTMSVNWADGSVPEPVTIGMDGHSFTATHPYRNDGVYDVSFSGGDGTDGTSSDVNVTVNNLSPTLGSAGLTTNPVNEGTTTTLTGSLSDPGVDDSFTLMVDWGDGGGPQPYTLGTSLSFAATYDYLNGPATNTISWWVGDDGGGTSATATATVAVNNVAPIFSSLSATATEINEGEIATLAGTIYDPGSSDTLTATVNWADGSGDLSIALVGNSFTITHRYLDNRGTGFLAGVAVIDGDGGSGATSINIAVDNLPPSFSSLAATSGPLEEGDIATVTGTLGDPGSLDTFSVTAIWGDGDSEDVPLDGGGTTFTITHRYVNNNSTNPNFPAQLVLYDDDGGSSVSTVQIAVQNVAPLFSSVGLLSGTIDENNVATLTGTMSDKGADDLYQLTVNWGDSSSPTVVSDNSGSTNFTLTHRYLDNPHGAGSFDIEMDVADSDGAHTPTSTAITVNNVNPSILSATVTPNPVNEGQEATLGGSLGDPGSQDTFTLVIDWADGSPQQTVPLDSSHTFGVTHVYPDGPLSSTLNIRVADSDGGSSGTATVLVNNVAPTLTNFSVSSYSINENDVVTVTSTISDPGTLDTFSAIMNWGDGTGDLTVSVDNDMRTFTATHQYLNAPGAVGCLPVQLTLTDDNGANCVSTFTTTVHNVAPSLTGFAFVNPEVDENDLNIETLTIDFDDPGTEDTFTLIVNWADGGSAQTKHYTSGERSLTLTHQYVDDESPSYVMGQSTSVFNVSIKLSDDADASTSATTTLTVDMYAPVPAVTSNVFINEGDVVTLSGTIDHPDLREEMSLVINWDDDTAPTTTSLAAGTTTFSLTHQNLEVHAGFSTIQLVARSHEGLSTDPATEQFVHITNVPPHITGISVTPFQAHVPGALSTADQLEATVTFNEPGGVDTYSFVWDPGQGDTFSYAAPITSGGTGLTRISSEYSWITYPSAGTYPFAVQITDNDGGSDIATISLTIVNGDPQAPDDVQIATPGVGLTKPIPGYDQVASLPGFGMWFHVAGNPAHGTFNDNGNGTYTYTPDSGYFGDDSFTYQYSYHHDYDPYTTLQTNVGTVTFHVAKIRSTTVNVLATTPVTVADSGTPGVFTFSRPEGSTEGDVTVHYHLNDDPTGAVAARPGTDFDDYEETSGTADDIVFGKDLTVVIPDGYSQAVVLINGYDSAFWDRTVEVDVDSETAPTDGGYFLDTDPDDLAEAPDGTTILYYINGYTLGISTSDEVTIIDPTGVSSPTTQNTDTESTGDQPEMVGRGPIVVGVQKGDVSVNWSAGAEQPVYIGNGSLHPVVTIAMALPAGFDDEEPLTAVLTMGRGTDGSLISSSPVTFDVAELSTSGTLQFVLQGDASQLPTGHYDYDVVFTGTAEVEVLVPTGDDANEDGIEDYTTDSVQSTVMRTIFGSTEIQNRVLDNPLGSGFSMTDVARIVPSNGSDSPMYGKGVSLPTGLDLARGDGSSAWFDNSTQMTFVTSTTKFADDASYSGSWDEAILGGYQYIDGSGTATWSFSELTPNTMYELSADWTPGFDRGKADYTVSDATPVGLTPSDGVITVDQRYGGTISLGFFEADGEGNLTVALSRAASGAGILIAGDVSVRRVATGSTPHGSFINSFESIGAAYDPNSEDPAEFDLTGKFDEQYLFNGAGYMTATVDSNNNATVYRYTEIYDGASAVSQVEYQDGETYSFSYTSGTLTTITDFADREWDYVVSTSHVTIQQPAPTEGADRPTFTFTMNGDGNLHIFEDANGNETTINYNDFRFHDAVNADTTTWTLVSVQATSAGQVFASGDDPPQAIYTNELGNQWKYTTDQYGYVTSETDPASNTWLYNRNPISPATVSDGLLTSMVQPADGGGWRSEPGDTALGELTTTYTYGTLGNLAQITYPDADHSTEKWTYGAANQVASYINQLGHKVVYDLDDFGNVVNVERYTGNSVLNYVLSDITTYSYSSAPLALGDLPGGLLEQTIDPLGNTSLRTYYTSGLNTGLLETYTVAVGTAAADATDYTYDGNRNEATETDETMETLTGKDWTETFDTDDLNRVIGETGHDPGVMGESQPHFLFVFDQVGNQIASIRPSQANGMVAYHMDGDDVVVDTGEGTLFGFSPMNQLVKQTDPIPSTNDGEDGESTTAPTTEYTFDKAGNPFTIKNPENQYTTFGFNSLNEQIWVRQPDAATGASSGGATSYSDYDSVGHLKLSVSARGFTSYYTYGPMGELIRQKDPATSQHNAPITTMMYDDAGELIKTTTGDRVKEYVYNDLGEQEQEIDDPDGVDAIWQTLYDHLGNVIKTLDPDNNEVDYEYDAQNEVKTQTQVGLTNEVTHYTYDPAGELLTEEDPLHHLVTYTYDTLGNVLTVNRAEGEVTTNRYDAWGELISTRDEEGDTTYFAYDFDGQKIGATDPDGKTTHFTFGLNGELTSYTDPDGNTTSYHFDGDGRPSGETVVVDSVEDTSEELYNDDGLLSQKTTANGDVIKYTYDEDDQLIKVDWMDGESIVASFTYTFDENEEMTSATEVEDSVTISSYTYSYDTSGRLEQVDIAATDYMPEIVLTYHYDAAGNRQTLSATVDGTDDFLNTYTYNSFSELTDITQAGQEGGNGVADKQASFSYYANGQLHYVNRYADTSSSPAQSVATATYGYDTSDRLTSLAYVVHNGLTSQNIAYAWSDYDTADRIGTLDYSSDYNLAFANTASYSYDPAGQLMTVTNTDEDLDNEAHAYDDNGNPMNGEESSSPEGFDNQIRDDGTYTYTYDDNGARTGRVRKTPIEGAPDNIEIYTWDRDQRLVQVTMKSDEETTVETIKYTYDVFNHLIGREVDTTVDDEPVAVHEAFVYDGDDLIFRFVDGSLANRYLHGPETGFVLADEQLDPESPTSAGTIAWLLGDNQNTAHDVVDSDGDQLDHLDYNSFGNLITQTNADFKEVIGYIGLVHDVDDNFDFTPNRVRDPISGGWLSKDPIGLGGGQSNLYDYDNNDPINRRDRSGLYADDPLAKPQTTLRGVITEKERVYLETMAILARAAYGDPPAKGWAKVTSWSPENYPKGEGYEKPPAGFGATLYKHGDEYVLSFRGTDARELLGPDGKADAKQALGIHTDQYDYAIKLTQKVAMHYDKLTLVGHSLGGGLATAAALVTQIPAVTFNAAGVHENTVKQYGIDVKNPKNKITAIQVAHNIVSPQDANPLKWLGFDILPDTVATERIDLSPRVTIETFLGWDLKKRHEINTVINLLGPEPK
jgi:RHS repeat-associated protein